ncbi:unnamed protein product [Chironomus riparius]|uniref:Uncharacterized protein n=1 Tax=Chironomus riparius TaxID=315576 RepID=A0A9N9RY67_9DIPT|nr:unnamed protein product [Chironomus riparius]
MAVAALVLGCVLAYVSASGEFEFHDDKGNCWRCTPGNSCERCKTSDNPISKLPINILPVWPNQCVIPDCEALRTQLVPLSTLFPSTISRKFYQCRQDPANTNVWVANERDCPCDTLFSYEQQACVFPFDWIPHCSNMINWDTEVCPGIPTTTTEAATTTTEASTTTSQSPCMCMPWWPCWCNPCWQMPCQSCSGCMTG